MSNPHYLKYKEQIKKATKEWKQKIDPEYYATKNRAGAKYHYYNNKSTILEKRRIDRLLNNERNRLFNMYDSFL